ncbi:hypothetical protein BS47DRAFT_1357629 [Hydnum rufescens UP504]|uniref:CxC1-like cysteine cluster associated with KDZ transposases domain-containing protein n=1 Tax=Hydnum rufescens UP504 TaxID=1448309 RepID=A0A9P6E2E1_9AGAM|nr:hypothetical protein BS47DRAFT_1357629 [Hydnum rufescens UP504]
MFSGIIKEGSGTGGSNVGLSLGVTEQPFVIQYLIHARGWNEHSVEKKLSHHVHWWAAAAHCWDWDVIPALIHPYMEYMRESQQGQAPLDSPSIHCSCTGHTVLKQVIAIYMDYYIELSICPCAPAPVQLVKRGLFLCSPVHPALSVSLEMLEFVSKLFMHLAPNEAAWADKLVKFLARWGHVFKAQDSLCQRFGSALAQYQVLLDSCNKAWDSKLPEFFLCLDACFTIQRNKDYDCCPGCKKQPGSQDPCIIPPGTHELPQSFLEAWKARVEAARPVKSHNHHTTHVSKKGKYAADVSDTEDDHVEPGLHVPNLYLDSCGKSFVAADGGRVKTPGGHFSDTGVMAGVCHHDRVIVWGNMWTPSKQQFYALAIIDFVMAQLPVDWKVGILYDVSCQIHQMYSMHMAISGYANCGIILRKVMAGVSLMERVVEHLDHSKMCEAGVWLEKPVKATKAWLALAEEKRARIHYSNEYLQLQFKEQWAYQSRPLERQSKKKGFHAVEKILSVHHHLYVAQDLVDVLQKQLLSVPVLDTVASRNEIVEITSALVEQEKVVVRLSKQDDDLTAVLKLGDPMSYDNLMKMKEHPWFEHQLNMHALKAHIIAKACQKNFEMDNLTGAFRSKAIDHNTMEHTSKALKWHYSSVKSLVVDYNKHHQSMIKLCSWRGIPWNAVIPPPIDIKGLFNLDVDNDIWQDVGLADDEFEGKVPPWLGDEDVQNGIRLVQELTNCHDELSLCERELYSFQLWFEEESVALMAALGACKGDPDVHFLMLEHVQWLTDLGRSKPQLDCMTVLAEHAGIQQQTRQPLDVLHNLDAEESVDSSDDGEDFELEPTPMPRDSALIVAMDLVDKNCSSDGGNEVDSSDEEESSNEL